MSRAEVLRGGIVASHTLTEVIFWNTKTIKNTIRNFSILSQCLSHFRGDLRSVDFYRFHRFLMWRCPRIHVGGKTCETKKFMQV